MGYNTTIERWLMLGKIINFFVHTPFYPHWLEFRNKIRGNERVVRLLYGKVLETGCGSGRTKIRALELNKKIKTYIATDFSSWDKSFEEHNKRVRSLGCITELLYGSIKDSTQIDKICSALDLPFGDRTFDVYCSFEVLEHVEDPIRFFREAHRVLKKGGLCITTMPFLYREHAGKDHDFQRFTRGGFVEMAKKNDFSVTSIFTYGFIGTTIASLTNQYIIRKIVEGNWIAKIVFMPLSPFYFFISNSVGYIIDTIDHDERFSPYYHVVMKKVK